MFRAEHAGGRSRNCRRMKPLDERPSCGIRQTGARRREQRARNRGAAPSFLVVWIESISTVGPASFANVGRARREAVQLLQIPEVRHNADENVHREAIRRAWRSNPSRRPRCPIQADRRSSRDARGAVAAENQPRGVAATLNVLRGEMSIVGPRPAIPYELDTSGLAHKRHL